MSESDEREVINRLLNNIREAVVIDTKKLELIIVALLARGHLLLEDVPGIGKTLVAKALAQSIHASFKRIQCTPDLLPSDITGGSIYNQKEQRFDFIPGPIFANIVLVDEVNRSSPRTQSSLLESMAESQVSVDGFSHNLPELFFIIATQNPIEIAGTFPLPEAQLDRFLISLDIGYPEFEKEVMILEREEHLDPLDSVKPVVGIETIKQLQISARAVDIIYPLKEYIVQLVTNSRNHPEVVLGVSPRGAVAIQRCAQTFALLHGRRFVTPDDIKNVAPAVMTHRILPRDRKTETAKKIVMDVMSTTRVPIN